MRRVESDADAVTVTTVHSAKGLEYPVVLVPVRRSPSPRTDRPYTFTRGTRRVVDVASWVPWIGPERCRRGATHRRAQGALRTAKSTATNSACCTSRSPGRAIGWSCGGRTRCRPGCARRSRASSPTATAGGPVATRSATAAPRRPWFAVDRCRRRGVGRCDRRSRGAVGDRAAAAGAVPTVTGALARAAARCPSLVGRSGMAVVVVHRRSPAGWPSVASSRWRRADPDAARWPADDDPDDGGADEPERRGPPLSECRSGRVPPTARRTRTLGSDLPLADVAGGTTFGTMVHRVLELVDFADPLPRRRPRRPRSAPAVRRAGLAVDADPIAAGLAAAVASPLGSLFDGRALGDLAAADRLTELTFDLALGDDAGTADRRPPTSAADGRDAAARRPAGALRRPLADDLDGVTLRAGSPARSTPCSGCRRRWCTATCSSTTRRTACTGRTTPAPRRLPSAPVWSRRWCTATTRCRRCCTPSPCTATWRCGSAPATPRGAPRRHRLPVPSRHGRRRHRRRVLVATAGGARHRRRRAVRR